MRLLLTCNPGLEDVTSMECMEELPGCRVLEERQGRGRVIAEAALNGVEDAYMNGSRLRSIHSLIILMVEERVGKGRDALEKVYKASLDAGLHRLVPEGSTFAVEAERIGEGHDYTSMDIARTVGQAVVDGAASSGKNVTVRLNSPQYTVYAEVDDDVFRAGLLVSGERSMHRRRYKVYDHPAALKPTLAYSMLRLAEARDGETVMDPMCGGGTVAIEAGLLLESSRIICLERNRAYLRGAVMNAHAARLAGRIEFIPGDATRLEDYLEPESIDVVVSNPPYGIRMGDPGFIRRLYKRLAPSLYNTMKPGGRAVLITADARSLARELANAGFKITHRRRVRHGDLWATILKAEKPS